MNALESGLAKIHSLEVTNFRQLEGAEYDAVSAHFAPLIAKNADDASRAKWAAIDAESNKMVKTHNEYIAARVEKTEAAIVLRCHTYSGNREALAQRMRADEVEGRLDVSQMALS